jgi:hypothetical protein
MELTPPTETPQTSSSALARSRSSSPAPSPLQITARASARSRRTEVFPNLLLPSLTESTPLRLQDNPTPLAAALVSRPDHCLPLCFSPSPDCVVLKKRASGRRILS